MTIQGPIYWNGTTFPSQDGDPVALTYDEWRDCCFPCGFATDPQPEVRVVSLGETYSGDANRQDAVDGTYAFTSFTEATCTWVWTSAKGTITLVWVSEVPEVPGDPPTPAIPAHFELTMLAGGLVLLFSGEYYDSCPYWHDEHHPWFVGWIKCDDGLPVHATLIGRAMVDENGGGAWGYTSIAFGGGCKLITEYTMPDTVTVTQGPGYDPPCDYPVDFSGVYTYDESKSTIYDDNFGFSRVYTRGTENTGDYGELTLDYYLDGYPDCTGAPRVDWYPDYWHMNTAMIQQEYGENHGTPEDPWYFNYEVGTMSQGTYGFLYPSEDGVGVSGPIYVLDNGNECDTIIYLGDAVP